MTNSAHGEEAGQPAGRAVVVRPQAGRRGGGQGGGDVGPPALVVDGAGDDRGQQRRAERGAEQGARGQAVPGLDRIDRLPAAQHAIEVDDQRRGHGHILRRPSIAGASPLRATVPADAERGGSRPA
jgi:hypothetical protein